MTNFGEVVDGPSDGRHDRDVLFVVVVVVVVLREWGEGRGPVEVALRGVYMSVDDWW